MKIGIFGDSFSVPHLPDLETNWFNVLANKLGGAKVDLHGKGGSSLFYSYKKFKKYNQRYDLNIFLVTSYERYTKPCTYIPKVETHFTGLDSINEFMKTYDIYLNDQQKDEIHSIEGWFKAMHTDFMKTTQELLIRDVEASHHNTLIYPCFSSSFDLERMLNEGIPFEYGTLYDIYLRQNEYLKENHFDFMDKMLGEKNVMTGHLAPEYNIFFGNLLYEKLIKKRYDFSSLVDITLPYGPDHYFYLEN